MKLTRKQKSKLSLIARHLGLRLVVVFGSKTRNEDSDQSDLDIAVLTNREPSYKLFTKMYHSFSDLFPGENLDVRFLNKSNPLFAIQVARDGALLYGEQEEFDEFRVMSNRRYIDDGRKYFPFRDQLLKEQQKVLQEVQK